MRFGCYFSVCYSRFWFLSHFCPVLHFLRSSSCYLCFHSWVLSWFILTDHFTPCVSLWWMFHHLSSSPCWDYLPVSHLCPVLCSALIYSTCYCLPLSVIKSMRCHFHLCRVFPGVLFHRLLVSGLFVDFCFFNPIPFLTCTHKSRVLLHLQIKHWTGSFLPGRAACALL